MERSFEIPGPELNANIESAPEAPESPPEIPPVQEASPPAVEIPPADAQEGLAGPEDDSLYDAPRKIQAQAEAPLELEDDSLYDVPSEAERPFGQEQALQETWAPPVENPAEMAKLEGDAAAKQAIEEVNKPVGEQMQDIEKQVMSEFPLSPEAQEAIRNGQAASQGLVETVPSDVVAPVRTDSQEHIDADLVNNEYRIEAAQSIAARNTAANVEAVARALKVDTTGAEEPVEAGGEQPR